jgi:hypothetical protein
VRVHFGCGLELHAFTLQEDRELWNQPFQAGLESGVPHRSRANPTRGALSIHVQDGTARAPSAGSEPDRQRRSSGEGRDPREAMGSITNGWFGVRGAGEIRDGQRDLARGRDSGFCGRLMR